MSELKINNIPRDQLIKIKGISNTTDSKTAELKLDALAKEAFVTFEADATKRKKLGEQILKTIPQNLQNLAKEEKIEDGIDIKQLDAIDIYLVRTTKYNDDYSARIAKKTYSDIPMNIKYAIFAYAHLNSLEKNWGKSAPATAYKASIDNTINKKEYANLIYQTLLINAQEMLKANNTNLEDVTKVLLFAIQGDSYSQANAVKNLPNITSVYDTLKLDENYRYEGKENASEAKDALRHIIKFMTSSADNLHTPITTGYQVSSNIIDSPQGKYNDGTKDIDDVYDNASVINNDRHNWTKLSQQQEYNSTKINDALKTYKQTETMLVTIKNAGVNFDEDHATEVKAKREWLEKWDKEYQEKVVADKNATEQAGKDKGYLKEAYELFTKTSTALSSNNQVILNIKQQDITATKTAANRSETAAKAYDSKEDEQVKKNDIKNKTTAAFDTAQSAAKALNISISDIISQDITPAHKTKLIAERVHKTIHEKISSNDKNQNALTKRIKDMVTIKDIYDVFISPEYKKIADGEQQDNHEIQRIFTDKALDIIGNMDRVKADGDENNTFDQMRKLRDAVDSYGNRHLLQKKQRTQISRLLFLFTNSQPVKATEVNFNKSPERIGETKGTIITQGVTSAETRVTVKTGLHDTYTSGAEILTAGQTLPQNIIDSYETGNLGNQFFNNKGVRAILYNGKLYFVDINNYTVEGEVNSSDYKIIYDGPNYIVITPGNGVKLGSESITYIGDTSTLDIPKRKYADGKIQVTGTGYDSSAYIILNGEKTPIPINTDGTIDLKQYAEMISNALVNGGIFRIEGSNGYIEDNLNTLIQMFIDAGLTVNYPTEDVKVKQESDVLNNDIVNRKKITITNQDKSSLKAEDIFTIKPDINVKANGKNGKVKKTSNGTYYLKGKVIITTTVPVLLPDGTIGLDVRTKEENYPIESKVTVDKFWAAMNKLANTSDKRVHAYDLGSFKGDFLEQLQLSNTDGLQISYNDNKTIELSTSDLYSYKLGNDIKTFTEKTLEDVIKAKTKDPNVKIDDIKLTQSETSGKSGLSGTIEIGGNVESNNSNKTLDTNIKGSLAYNSSRVGNLGLEAEAKKRNVISGENKGDKQYEGKIDLSWLYSLNNSIDILANPYFEHRFLNNKWSSVSNSGIIAGADLNGSLFRFGHSYVTGNVGGLVSYNRAIFHGDKFSQDSILFGPEGGIGYNNFKTTFKAIFGYTEDFGTRFYKGGVDLNHTSKLSDNIKLNLNVGVTSENLYVDSSERSTILRGGFNLWYGDRINLGGSLSRDIQQRKWYYTGEATVPLDWLFRTENIYGKFFYTQEKGPDGQSSSTVGGSVGTKIPTGN